MIKGKDEVKRIINNGGVLHEGVISGTAWITRVGGGIDEVDGRTFNALLVKGEIKALRTNDYPTLTYSLVS